MKPPAWTRYTLGDLIHVKHGYAFEGKYFSDCGDLIVLSPRNFQRQGGFKFKIKEKFYNGKIPDGYILKQGDLLMVLTEQSEGMLGSVAIMPENNRFLHNQRLGLITILDHSKICDSFLFYLLCNAEVKKRIAATANGINVQHTSPSRIYSIAVEIPPIPVQRKIAGILSTYDRLIINNQRRIQILEEMVVNLYREWFVSLRFPVLKSDGSIKYFYNPKTDPMQDFDHGHMPSGWTAGTLGQICEVIHGFVFKSKDWQKSGIPVIKTENILADNSVDTSSGSLVSEELFQRLKPKFRLGNGDIVIAMTSSNAGKIGFLRTTKTFLLNQRVVKLIPALDYSSYLWSMFSTPECQQIFFKMANGTAQPNISILQLRKVPCVIPDEEIAKKFNTVAAPMILQIEKLFLAKANLEQTKAMLLSELFNGKGSIK